MSGDNYLLTYLIMPKLSIEILLQSFLLMCVHRRILQCTTLSRGYFFNKKSTTLVARVWTCQDTVSGGQELLNLGGFCCFIYKTTKMTD